MLANDAGQMVQDTWHEIPTSYPGIELDVMQIMPNHLHGIIIICVGEGPCALPTAPCGRPYPAIGQCPAKRNGQAQGPVPTGILSLSDVIAD